MKTTRKGFTLIELIVVIAIIGVLAAILVPAMLGWVKKSKIQAANADAKTIMTNINAGLEEIDEEGRDITLGNGWYGTLDEGGEGGAGGTGGTGGTTGGTTSTDVTTWDTVLEYVKEYSDSITTARYSARLQEGVVIACVARSGKYYGTYPAGLTNKNYNDATDGLGDNPDLSDAWDYAIDQYNDGRSTDATLQAGTAANG